ncbi:helix-turn-helix domain-containing protein [Corynebacterium variabile]|uniref:helix-turn-helix domain-containing protein n=1 Tax=Corynebacterium variabile TaxID=1727 RepID=UPI00289A8B0B|nr:helix-turn-helix transcriptional regulator [Corynebacterium variabile]
MEHTAWIEALIGTDTRREASKKAGMSESTLSRQLGRNALSPEMVIALCRAYEKKPVDGLVQTGFLNPWEAEGISVDAALDQATNQELLGAVMRRSDPDALYLFGRTDDLLNPEDSDNVTYLPSNTQGEDDTPAVQSDWDDMPEDAVADSSPEEGGTPDDYEP